MNNQNIKIGTNRNFGIVFFVFFLIISLYPILNDSEIRIWSLVIAIIFLILGLINSKLLTPLKLFWHKFGIFLGIIVSPLIMGIVFFLVITPISLIMKLFNKDLLNLKKNNDSTYWITKDKNKSTMKNQF